MASPGPTRAIVLLSLILLVVPLSGCVEEASRSSPSDAETGDDATLAAHTESGDECGVQAGEDARCWTLAVRMENQALDADLDLRSVDWRLVTSTGNIYDARETGAGDQPSGLAAGSTTTFHLEFEIHDGGQPAELRGYGTSDEIRWETNVWNPVDAFPDNDEKTTETDGGAEGSEETTAAQDEEGGTISRQEDDDSARFFVRDAIGHVDQVDGANDARDSALDGVNVTIALAPGADAVGLKSMILRWQSGDTLEELSHASIGTDDAAFNDLASGFNVTQVKEAEGAPDYVLEEGDRVRIVLELAETEEIATRSTVDVLLIPEVGSPVDASFKTPATYGGERFISLR